MAKSFIGSFWILSRKDLLFFGSLFFSTRSEAVINIFIYHRPFVIHKKQSNGKD